MCVLLKIHMLHWCKRGCTTLSMENAFGGPPWPNIESLHKISDPFQSLKSRLDSSNSWVFWWQMILTQLISPKHQSPWNVLLQDSLELFSKNPHELLWLTEPLDTIQAIAQDLLGHPSHMHSCHSVLLPYMTSIIRFLITYQNET